MEIYLLNLAWVWSCSIIATKVTEKYDNPRLNKFGYIEAERLLAFIAFMSLFLVAALRWKVGTDYWQYEAIFEGGASYTIEDITTRAPEYFSALLNWGIGVVFDDARVNFAVYSFFICYLFTKGIKNYSDNYWMSMVLYILTMNYYGSYNGIIQWMASGILFLGYRYLVKKELKKYLITILIATMFHSTALLGIPLYFVVNRKFKTKSNVVLVFIFILATIFLSSYLDNVLALLEDTSYSNYSEVWFTEDGRSANPLRFVVSAVPFIIGWIYYDKLKDLRLDVDILLNFSLLNSMFYLLGLRNYIFIRFAIYTDIYNVFLIPLFIKLFKNNERKLVLYVILACYFLYMYLLLPRDSNLLPYQTIFSNM